MKSRLAFVDWTRGLAAVIMLQGHVFHAFTRPDLRSELPYVLSQFAGGMPPAIFLFLTGVTLAFLMDSRGRQGDGPARRLMAALRRAAYLLALAFAFRLQMWAFAWPHSPWTDLLRVDILNCMGFTLAVLAPMAAWDTRRRMVAAAAAGVAIAGASPLVSQLPWSGIPVTLKAYVTPDPLQFSFFPWAAFAAFGLSAGSALRLAKASGLPVWIPRMAVAGFGLILLGRLLAYLPYSPYPQSSFWLDSPLLIFIKLGVILVILAGAYHWTEHRGPRWSWVQQLGTTSLLVYWVHTELVYGRWFYFWKASLNAAYAALAALAVILLMLALSTARMRWKELPQPRVRLLPSAGLKASALRSGVALET